MFILHRLSGLSPFMGDSDVETLSNVTHGEFDFDDESFEEISEDAKHFIDHLLIKDKRYVSVFTHKNCNGGCWPYFIFTTYEILFTFMQTQIYGEKVFSKRKDFIPQGADSWGIKFLLLF